MTQINIRNLYKLTSALQISRYLILLSNPQSNKDSQNIIKQFTQPILIKISTHACASSVGDEKRYSRL